MNERTLSTHFAIACALATSLSLAGCDKEKDKEKSADQKSSNTPSASKVSDSALLTKKQLLNKEICAKILDPATIAKTTGLDLASLELLAHGSAGCNVGTGASPYRIGFAFSIVETSVEKAATVFANTTVGHDTGKVVTTYTDVSGIGDQAKLSKQTMNRIVTYEVVVLVRNAIFGVRVDGKSLDDAAKQEKSKTLAKSIADQIQAM